MGAFSVRQRDPQVRPGSFGNMDTHADRPGRARLEPSDDELAWRAHEDLRPPASAVAAGSTSRGQPTMPSPMSTTSCAHSTRPSERLRRAVAEREKAATVRDNVFDLNVARQAENYGQVPGSVPTMPTNDTASPGPPPRLCVSARDLPAATVPTVRSVGAMPRSCSQHSNIMRRPDAPIG